MHEGEQEKNMIGRIRNGLIAVSCMIIILGTTVFAENSVSVAGTYTGDNWFAVYIKGVENTESISCQIGTRANQTITCENVQDMETDVKTLIMLDNSLSIPKNDREKIKEVLKEYAYQKPVDEKVCIVTFSEESTILTDFVSDKNDISDALDKLEYKDQNTYLTDVLYEILNTNQMGTEDCYRKIIIISDGVDNKAIGYTREELNDLLKTKNIPIYTLGCVNKKNEEQLENMFALSRYTGGKSWILEDVQETNNIANSILEDSQAVHVVITPEADLLDGNVRNVIIHIGESQIECSIKMPTQAIEKEEPVETSNNQEEKKSEIAAVQPNKTRISGSIIVLIIMGGALLIAGGVTIVVIVMRLRKKSDEFTALQNPVLILNDDDSEETEIVGIQNANSDSTQMLWNGEMKTHQLVLIDENNPGRTLQTPIRGAIIVGRKPGESNLIIDYDKSISGKHCQITEKDGKFYLKDLQSSNGTFMNETRLLSEVEIHSGCKIRLGRVVLRVEIK